MPLKLRRRPALLTVDLEDYRSIRLKDYGHPNPITNAFEVERQVERVLELLDSLGISATFFCVGGLASILSAAVWQEISRGHDLGAHGLEHVRVRQQGARRFGEDLVRTKSVLEDVSGKPVLAYRAPYFSVEGCSAWFGATLVRAGFAVDSSLRMVFPPPGFKGVLPLSGSDGRVVEIPFPCIGARATRLTIIGGSYFRLLPLSVTEKLLAAAETLGFIPMIYLHPYDLDPDAVPLGTAGVKKVWSLRVGDRMRHAGRTTTAEKLRALAKTYEFRSIESLRPDTRGLIQVSANPSHRANF